MEIVSLLIILIFGSDFPTDIEKGAIESRYRSYTNRTAVIEVHRTSIRVASEDNVTIHFDYLRYQYAGSETKDKTLFNWVNYRVDNHEIHLYIGSPDLFAAAMYALRNRPVIVISDDFNVLYGKWQMLSVY